MFDALFDKEDFAASHLMVVVATGLAFLALQLALSIRFYVRMRRQQRIIDAWNQRLKQDRDNRQQLAPPNDFGWLKWVLTNYSESAAGAPSNFSREDALQELDVRIASSGDYLLLQRMGIMAPLLGVVLTVIGFYWLKIGEQQQSLQAILLAVAPLVSGVGAGAVLALINQALLHVAGHRAESLRMAAREWFDTAIWSQIDLDARAATGRAVTAMDQLNTSIVGASSRYALGANQIHESTAAMNTAASHFREMVQSFRAEIKGMPEALAEVRRATTASAGALEELIRIGSRAVANLDVSVAAFRTTIEREFTTAAKLQHRSGPQMGDVDAVNQSMQRLQVAADDISRGSTTLNAMREEFSQFVSQTTASHETLAQAAGNLTVAVSELRSELKHRSDQAGATTHHAHAIDEVSASLGQITRQLSEFVSAGIDPATRRLAALHDTLADFEDAYDAQVTFDDSQTNTAPVTSGNNGGDEAVDSQRGFLRWLSRRPR